jgi:hypothetical protein
MADFSNGPQAVLSRPRPKNPIGRATYDSYLAVFRKIYKVQIAKKVCAMPWDQIWVEMAFDELLKHVKERTPMMKKLTYAEKLDGEFAPYMIVEHYSAIEMLMWSDANVRSMRSLNCALRHRYCVLHLLDKWYPQV